MDLYNLQVELSGFGHYGVRTIVNKDLYFNSLEFMAKQERPRGWEYPFEIGYLPTQIGFDHSLKARLDPDDEDLVGLYWLPDKISEAMRSHELLDHIAWNVVFGNGQQQARLDEQHNGRNLYVSTKKADRGWWVKANFGDQIWDVIESEKFSELLPTINSSIQSWWQDDGNSEQRAQYATVFRGNDGPTLQVYAPGSQGLWIVGARKSNGEHQLVDHNTDSSRDAFSHVFSLCTILKCCRDALDNR